jgi:4-diphosphocytidyl-2-C-methyl-D-erythritol kinase
MVSQKCFAKVNICLKVNDKNGEYHDLESIVMSVDKYDVVTASKRKDDKILVTFVGPYAVTPKVQEETNAYKTAKLFKETFNTKGVNITVKVNIPNCSGMGGSSSDIAGVLGAMKKLFKISADMKPLADKLGSDSGYLLSCGFARTQGRGEIVTHLKTEHKYYFVVIYGKHGVSTKECFRIFDEEFSSNKKEIDVDMVEKGIIDGDLALVSKYTGNDLYNPAVKINPEVEENLNALKDLSPELCFMTGSGATVVAMYNHREMATWAHSKLKKKYGKRVEVLSFYNPDELSALDRLFGYIPPEF